MCDVRVLLRSGTSPQAELTFPTRAGCEDHGPQGQAKGYPCILCGPSPPKPGKGTAALRCPRRTSGRPEDAWEKGGYTHELLSNATTPLLWLIPHNTISGTLCSSACKGGKSSSYPLSHLKLWSWQLQHASLPGEQKYMKMLVTIGRLGKFLAVTLSIEAPITNKFLPSCLIFL